MIGFTNELNSIENNYKMNLNEYKILKEKALNNFRFQSKIKRNDFNELEKNYKNNKIFFKDIINEFNFLINDLNNKDLKKEKIPKQLIKSVKKSINTLNRFIEDIKQYSKLLNEIKKI
jgi:hypothetical protein